MILQRNNSVLPLESRQDSPTEQRKAHGVRFAAMNSTHRAQSRLPPLVLSSQTFVAFWILLFVLHAASAMFLVACARLYWFLEHPYLKYYANLLAPAEDRHFKLFGTLLGTLGAWNVMECISLILASYRARTAAVPPAGVFQSILRLFVRVKMRLFGAVHPTQPISQSHMTRMHSLMEKCTTLFSIDSKIFGTVFMTRELFVIIAQAIQCYSFSMRITRPWINHVSVALVVTNCVVVALLYHLLRRYDRYIQKASLRNASFASSSWRVSSTFARLLCNVFDCLLTFAMSMVLPVVIIVPYIQMYDPEQFSFSLALLYSDTDFPKLIRENQALFARSWIDICYKFVPHMSIYFSLVVIANVLRTCKIISKEISPASVDTSVVKAPHEDILRIFEIRRPDQSENLPMPCALRLRRKQKPSIRSHMRKHGIEMFFMILGVCIIALHSTAMLSNSAQVSVSTNKISSCGDTITNLCLQPVYPWFTTGNSCAVVEFDCHKHNLATPPTTMFDSLNADTVSVVIFSHCSALVVPPAIQSLSNLLGIEIYNSTIAEWSVDASLSHTHHPHMAFLFFVLTNMTELPPGVLQDPFPNRLGDIEFSHTNLTSFPASLPTVWAKVELIYLEYSLVTELPVEVVSLPALAELSLIGNEIAVLPDDFSEKIVLDDFYVLALCSNPLTSLPSTLRSGLQFGVLSLEYTNIDSIPEWVSERVKSIQFLFGTPYCSSNEANSTMKPGCLVRDKLSDGRYPFSLVTGIAASTGLYYLNAFVVLRPGAYELEPCHSHVQVDPASMKAFAIKSKITKVHLES